MIQHAFEVRRDQDIHRRAGRSVERTVPVVSAGPDEIGQHVVPVGGADQFRDRHAHVFGIDGGQDVAEIAGRHRHIERFARLDPARPDQVAVSGHIIDDLRHQTAEIDGVGGREFHIFLRQELFHIRIGENIFDAGLGIVEITVDRTDRHVAAGLRGHLQFLHRTDPVLRIKYDDAGFIDVRETVQRGLAGIARSGDQDDHGAAGRGFRGGGGQQIRQQLQRHVLESTGRPVPEFQQVHAGRDFDQRRRIVVFERARISALHAAFDLRRREIGQKKRKDGFGAFLVIHRRHPGNQFIGEPGKILRNEETAVFGYAFGDDLGGFQRQVPASACKLHISIPSMIIVFF